MLDQVVIVGAGLTSQGLVQRLSSLAPVVVVDTSEQALSGVEQEAFAVETTPAKRAQHPVTLKHGDGTSRLVLEDIRKSGGQFSAMVAATGDDRTNLEVCRLAGELGFSPIVAITIDPRKEQSYRAAGVRTIVRATLLGDMVERAVQLDGIAIASNVGLGTGDVMEIKVMASSPVIGVPLAQLNPDGWHVAAIYRAGQLVIPSGSSTIEADDRVLLVGDPAFLPHVAENLRVGVPTFPLRHGPNVVVYLPRGRDRAIETEAEVLALTTRASGLVRVYPGAARSRTVIEPSPGLDPGPASQRNKWFDDAPLEGDSVEHHVACLERYRPGVLVAGIPPRSFRDRLTGSGGPRADLCNRLRVPVLFPSGAPRYQRVVYLACGGATLRSAETAIDLARMYGLSLSVLRVELPRFFGVSSTELGPLVEAIERRTRIYRLETETASLLGNPVKVTLAHVQRADILVVDRSPAIRDSFTSPDIALRLARQARCSVLVHTG